MLRSASRAARVPVELLHELTHAAAAAPWATDWQIVVGPGEAELSMHTVVEFRDDTPAWAEAFAHLAPFVTGLLGALVAGLMLMLGRGIGGVTGWDLLVYSALGMAWALYTLPSRADLEGARAALEADDDG